MVLAGQKRGKTQAEDAKTNAVRLKGAVCRDGARKVLSRCGVDVVHLRMQKRRLTCRPESTAVTTS